MTITLGVGGVIVPKIVPRFCANAATLTTSKTASAIIVRVIVPPNIGTVRLRLIAREYSNADRCRRTLLLVGFELRDSFVQRRRRSPILAQGNALGCETGRLPGTLKEFAKLVG